MSEKSFEELIRKYAGQICSSTSGEIYFKPDIPEKKLKNAIESYANDIVPSNVIVLYDSTVFGGAKEGFLMTLAGFYAKKLSGKPKQVDFSSIKSIEAGQEEIPQKNKSTKIERYLQIHFQDETTITFNQDDSDIQIREFQDFLEEVLAYKQEGLVNETDKFIIVEDMPDEVKVNYLKAIVQMTKEDDGIIDAKELAEIQVLLTQLKFGPELRHEIRKYVFNPHFKIDEILRIMDNHVPKGSEYALHISLLKDMIRVHRSTKEDESIESRGDFIVNIADKYGITEEQIEVIEQACKNDEMILRGDVDDKMIIAGAKDLAARAGAVGIPIAAVYLSGSVVGLSAAGITSGLAAWGLGGILGFSSMVSGIGVLVVVGVGAYQGIKWLTGGGKREKLSQREFMIQEIFRLNQQAINNLVEDVNFFGLKIVKLTKESEINKKLIEKLGRELTVFIKAFKVLQSKGTDLEGLFDEST
jgi:hypothetical protein